MENNYAILERNISDIIYHFDFNKAQYTYMNRAGRRFYGIKVNEIPILGEKLINQIHPDDSQRIKKVHNTILSEGLENVEIEYRIKNSDNEYRWLPLEVLPYGRPVLLKDHWRWPVPGSLPVVFPDKNHRKYFDKIPRVHPHLLRIVKDWGYVPTHILKEQ